MMTVQAQVEGSFGVLYVESDSMMRVEMLVMMIECIAWQTGG